MKSKISDFVADAPYWASRMRKSRRSSPSFTARMATCSKKPFVAGSSILSDSAFPEGSIPERAPRFGTRNRSYYEWAFCLELAEFGLDPTAIVRLMEQKFKDDILPHLVEARLQRDSDDLYFVASPSLMSAAWQSKEPLPYRWLKSSDAAIWLDRMGRSPQTPRRAIVINVTVLCNTIGRLV